jgi:phage FluMu protein Com
MDLARCLKCNRRLIVEANDDGPTKLRCLRCNEFYPLKTNAANGPKAAWHNRQGPGSEAKLDDEFYKERARHVRELAAKADPFIRKRLLDLAGNYDALVRRSPRTTATVPSSLPNVPARE